MAFLKEEKMRRINLKKIIPALFLGMILLIMPYVLVSQTQQYLQIHYINVEQGQSTLIIGPNGTIILYDGGNEFKGTNEVVPYLQSIGITTNRTLDYIIASHRDTDHYMGLTEVMNYGYDALHVYDNGSNKYNDIVQLFLNAAAQTTAGSVVPIQLGQVIDLGNGATATCVAVNGSVIGTGAVPNGQDNENDRAVVLLVKYGNFEYLVTGDLGGGSDETTCTGRSTSQVNIETPLVKAIMPAGVNPLLSLYGVEVAHVGHHGSESSTNTDYMNVLSPTIACISVGAGQGTDWFHPRIDVVDHVLLAGVSCITAPPALVLQTEEGSPTGEKTSFSGYCVGDFVIQTDGASTYTVTANGAVSQGPDERVAAELPRTFYFDEVTAVDTAPVLYDIHDANITRTTADIIWSTNELATSVVRYGTTSGTYPYTASSATLVLNHTVSLSGLTQFLTYYYVVESTDATNHTTVSTERSFQAVNTSDIKVVFSELFYDTPGTDSEEEWIELYNNSPVNIDLTGWKITDNNGSGSTYTFPAGTVIQSGTYLTVAINSGGFLALYGYDADLYGSIPSMNNDGDALVLKNKSGVIIDAVGYEGGSTAGLPTGWGSTTLPSAPLGSTIVRTSSTTDTDTYADWSVAANNGYPQTQFMNNSSYMKVVFSEVFYDTPGTDSVEEWIELYNNSPMAVDISGWTITDNNGTGSVYTIPQGKTIAAHSYYTIAINSTGFLNLYGYNADLYGAIPSLNNDGDALILKDSTGVVKDAVAWEGGASAGVPTGWGSTTLPAVLTASTIVRTDVTTDSDLYTDWSSLANNGYPQTQSCAFRIVISEVFYDTPGTDSVEEWIELYNNTPVTVNIGGWKIVDNNGTGTTFTIPTGNTIAPGTFFTMAVDSTGFNALYSYNADIYGAIPALNNDGDSLLLKDSYGNIVDAVAWEGGGTGGVPTGWGSTTAPSAATGSTIVRSSVTTDTNTYADWTTAANNGNPQTQTSGIIKVVFSEVFYDTPGTDSVEEWIELYNNSTSTVDISGWTITDNNGTGATYTIPSGHSIAAGGHFTIAINSTGFLALYSYNANLYGVIPSLNNDGDALILKNSSGTVMDTVAWEGGASAGVPTGWGSTTAPSAPTGSTIVRSSVTTDTDTYADWTTASNNGNPEIQ